LWHPNAERNEIVPGSNDPAIIPVGVIVHVAVSEARSLIPIFRARNGIESHFYVRRDGSFEQYRDTGREADANYKANSFIQDGKRKGYISIETQGMGPGEWTVDQIATLTYLILDLAHEHDFPVTKATSPFSGGVGYHSQYNGIWTPAAKSCPGYDRIKQFDNELIPALKNNGGSALSWNEDIDAWEPGDNNKSDTLSAGQQLNQARGFAKAAFKAANSANNKSKRIENAIKALASGLGDEVRAAVEAALSAEVTADVDVHITPKGQ
jgi:hypothetical protein